MDKFEDIIKQKVEQFEPKFNEAHWFALDQKLTTIKKAKIRKHLIMSTAAVIIVAVGVFSIYQNITHKETNTLTQVPVNTAVVEETNTVSPSTVQQELNNEQKQEKQIIPVLPADEVKLEKIETSNVQAPIQKTESTIIDGINDKSIKNTVNQLSGSFEVLNNKVCLGEEVSFEAADNKELLAYTWDFGDGTFSSKQNPKHVYKQSGIYSVSLSVVNKRTNEEVKSIQRNSVTIYSLPNVDFSYLEQSTQYDDNKLKYPTTIFNCKGDLSDVYEWNFGNGKTLKDKQPSVLFDKKGEYQVSLKAKNSNGCSNTTTKAVTIITSFELYAPSAFTPNFDGNNDEFMPEALTTWDIKFEMIIKNKSGNVIYKTTDRNNAWKGSLNNQGAILEEGIYVWQIVTYDVDGKPYQHAGKINLMK
jgi:PKD repeat protein